MRVSEGERDVMEWEKVETDADQPQEEGRIGTAGACQILSPFSGLNAQYELALAIWQV